MIQERVKAGLARAKVSKYVEAQILALQESTEPPMGILKIAQSLAPCKGLLKKSQINPLKSNRIIH